MIDISLPLDDKLIAYPGDASFEFYPYYTHEKNGVAITRLIMETHTGTHIDAPFHAMKDGETMGMIPLSKLIGPATVVEVTGNFVRAADIPDTSEKRLLFKTVNSSLYGSFSKDFCYISMEAAEKMVDMEIELVGMDYLSIEEFGTTGMPVHKKLLSNGIVIVEGLYMKDVRPGGYGLTCLPMKLDMDGAPCRAILTE